ncbi:MAG: hypothetical protein PVF45_12445, partial [Anaerolineae bacterium]
LPMDRDLYRLRVVVDEEEQLSEQNEHNNQRAWPVPIAVSARLVPTATTVLTSFSGAVRLTFPAGTVITPVDVIYTPWWPEKPFPVPLKPSPVAFVLTTVPDVPLARPVSITWRYGDDGTAGLAEEALRLFVQREEWNWRDAACQPYQRTPEQNQVTALVCQTGKFVFGNRYDLYLPMSLREISLPAAYQEIAQENGWLQRLW